MRSVETVPSLILAIDPGRDKCGLALVRGDGAPQRLAVVAISEAADRIAEWQRHFMPQTVLLGDGTGSRSLRTLLEARGIPTRPAPERNTTREARTLYFQAHPPRGLRRLLPQGFLFPPVPIDDYAALAIALAWLRVQR